jgi:hypothetical protein
MKGRQCGARVDRILGGALGLALIGGCSSDAKRAITPAPDGKAALKASVDAIARIPRFTLERETPGTQVSGLSRVEVDCASGYYHKWEEVNRSADHVQNGKTLSQGHPTPRSEYEWLHVGGRSYRRATPEWDSEGTGDPAWGVSANSLATRGDCSHAESELQEFLAQYRKVLAKATRIVFVDRQEVGGRPCDEFQVTFTDKVYGERMIERDHGDGSRSSSRAQIEASVGARFCLGVEDRLPYLMATDDPAFGTVRIRLSTAEFTRLDPPPGVEMPSWLGSQPE